VQCVDGQTGIVGDGRHAGAAPHRPGLDQGVFGKRRAGLFGILMIDLGQLMDPVAQRLKHFPVLPHLVGIAGGDHDVFHRVRSFPLRVLL
jgi:hypothetical protein